MNQLMTKRNLIIAGIVIVLLALVVIAVFFQMKSALPVISFDYGAEGLDERESEIYPKLFAINWENAPEEQAKNGEDVLNVGYATVMQEQSSSSILYSGHRVGFSFDTQPKGVSLSVYDVEGNKIDYQELSEFAFTTPFESGDFLYVLEGVWEQGTCGYAFWITVQ